MTEIYTEEFMNEAREFQKAAWKFLRACGMTNGGDGTTLKFYAFYQGSQSITVKRSGSTWGPLHVNLDRHG